MSEAIDYPSVTPHFALPLLIAGQAQKEFFVNQSFALIDSLLSLTVLATRSTPPAEPSQGATYLVGSNASGGWVNLEDNIVVFVSGAWHSVQPVNGLAVFDSEAQQRRFYSDGWITANSPTEPVGGNVVDEEARFAITELTQALKNAGILQGS
ncbi:MAG: DUF2793 domain-containing protein [Pseudomonadota bacterium]